MAKEKEEKKKSSKEKDVKKDKKAAEVKTPEKETKVLPVSEQKKKSEQKAESDATTAADVISKNKESSEKSEEKPKEATTAAAPEKEVDTSEAVENGSNQKKPLPIKLTYFNGTGRAELSRLIMSAAGIEFDDHRLDAQEWAELKPKTPFSQVPILEYHGVTIGQSLTIARFLAKKTNMYGKDEFEQAKVDAVVDYVSDYNNKWVNVFRANTFDERAELIHNILVNFLPLFFRNLQALLAKEGGQYFAGGNLSMADVAVFQILHAFTDPDDPFLVTLPDVEDRFSMLDAFPLLLKHKERVHAVPGIKGWIQSRPQGLF